MILYILLVYVNLFSYKVYSEEDSKLLLVQALFRHGDRAPRFSYPTNQNSKDIWPEGLGKLTMIGKKQQYALGKYLRSMYQDFITTNPNEVLVNSSASQRCLTSAMVTMASFYAPEESWEIEEGLNWQPITIHYLPAFQDKYLSFKGTCPRAMAEMKRTLNMPGLLQKYQAMFEDVSNYAGLNISEGINALNLYDTLQIEKLHNFTIPEWAHLYWEDLKEIETSILTSYVTSPLSQRLRAGPLLQYIDQNIKNKINGEIPHLKVQLYCAHDLNIATVFLALNFTNMPRPPYGATLLFELHEMSDASKTVRLLYLNSTDPIADMQKPHILELEGCSVFCPVENFTKIFQNMIPENWEQECQLSISDSCDVDNRKTSHDPLYY